MKVRYILSLLVLCLLAITNAVADCSEPNVYFAYRSFLPEHETMKRFAEVGVHTYCIFPANTTN